ncbi:MAG: MBL fold metallo-hydrolase, partial [Thaumarchaeota archaeon]|nr:MBL fold metallo-hydrolase [Nitrososphaerota archaeon]
MENLKVEVLVEDTENPEKPMLWTEHGLSILITAEVGDKDVRILFDTGASGGPLVHNADLMKTDLKKVDVIVLSHGHYDHTGGLVAALEEIRPEIPIPIILHPDALGRKFALKPKIRYTGIPYT